MDRYFRGSCGQEQSCETLGSHDEEAATKILDV